MTKHYHLVDTHEAMTALFKGVLDSGHVAIDVRTDTSDPMTCELVGLGLSPRPRIGYYIPLAHPAHPGLSLKDVLPWLQFICIEDWITTCFYDTVFALIVLERHKIPVSEPIYDVLVTEHGLDNGRHSKFTPRDFPYIVKRKLGYAFPEISAVTGVGKKKIPYNEAPIDDAVVYSAATADLVMRFYYAQKLSPNNQLKHEQVDYPLLPILKNMTMTGIRVDLDYLHQMKDEVEDKILELQDRLDSTAGCAVSVYQYRQLSELLFDKLKLVPGEGQVKNQGDFFPTGKEHLQQIEAQHPIVSVILHLRQMYYALSHHLEPLATKTLHGRIHSQFRPITASTRISCFDLDLHNVIVEPLVTGHLVRKAFIVPGGYKWVKADYSQIDLRVLSDLIVCQLSDWRYAEIFLAGGDPHRMTAATIFNVPVEQVSDEQRRIAKAINFAIIYGMGVNGLQRKLSCARDEAQQFYQAYMRAYPVEEWMEYQKAIAERNSYVETPYYKTRRYVTPGDWRAGLNHPIQGGAAEIMRVVMIEMQKILTDRPDLDTLMLLQVHDELDFQVPEHSLVEFVPILTRVMTETFELAVPLEIEVQVGDNWAELEPFYR